MHHPALKRLPAIFSNNALLSLAFSIIINCNLLLKGVFDVKPVLPHNTIVLCGFMGCGKTTIGKMLASALNPVKAISAIWSIRLCRRRRPFHIA